MDSSHYGARQSAELQGDSEGVAVASAPHCRERKGTSHRAELPTFCRDDIAECVATVLAGRRVTSKGTYMWKPDFGHPSFDVCARASIKELDRVLADEEVGISILYPWL